MSLEKFEDSLSSGAVEPNLEMLPEIESAQSFEELYESIDKIGALKGSTREYSAEELKDKISKAESAPFFLNSVTRSGGLRDKVKELLDKKNSQ